MKALNLKIIIIASLVAILSLPSIAIASDSSSSFFPLLADRAKERGYKVPRPYGFSISAINLDQTIALGDLELQNIPGIGNAASVLVSNAENHNESYAMRGDVWVLPFLNVYGLVSHTETDALATIEGSSCDESQIDGGINIGGRILCGLLNNELNDFFEGNHVPFPMGQTGTTVAVGTTLVGGYNQAFSSLGMVFSRTYLNTTDGYAKAFLLMPRVGYRFNVSKGEELRVWAGAQYQHITSTSYGSFTDIGFGSAWKDATFSVDRKAATPWNPVIGANLEFNSHWNVVIEAGLGERKSAFIMLDRRFGN